MTPETCSCPCFSQHKTCKHYLGLAALAKTEVSRYTLLGWHEDRARVEQFLAEYEFAPYAEQVARMEDAE